MRNTKGKRGVRRRWLVFPLVLLLGYSCILFGGCSGQTAAEPEPEPEVGKWHAEVTMDDINGDSMSEDDQMLLTLLAGNIAFDIDVEFYDDGTFTYELNTDQLEEAVSNSVSSIVGLFTSFDASIFTDRIVESVLHESESEYEGTYEKDESGLITAHDMSGDILLFQLNVHSISQLDGDGNEVARFSEVSGESQ